MMASKNNCNTKKGREDLVLQLNKQHLSSNYKLSGGMYSDNADNLPWDNLVNKLALIGRLPFDCGSSCGDCFFASMGHGLYSNADLHFHIRNAGITHMINNPELKVLLMCHGIITFMRCPNKEHGVIMLSYKQ